MSLFRSRFLPAPLPNPFFSPPSRAFFSPSRRSAPPRPTPIAGRGAGKTAATAAAATRRLRTRVRDNGPARGENGVGGGEPGGKKYANFSFRKLSIVPTADAPRAKASPPPEPRVHIIIR